MKFSQRMSHAKLSQNELQQFEKKLLGQRFWKVYFDSVWSTMLSHQAYIVGFHKIYEQISDIPIPLKTYINGVWRNFFAGNPATLPTTIETFQQKLKTLFSNIESWEGWCKLYEFWEYTIERLERLTSDENDDEVRLEINEILIENEIGYKLIDGKFELIKKFKNVDELIDNQLLIKSLYLKNISLFSEIEITFDITKPVICFVGGNGSGKTTILRAIVLGLIGANAFRSEPLNLLTIREAQKDKFYEKRGIIEINYSFHQQIAQDQVYFRAVDQDRNFLLSNGEGMFLINANDNLLKTLIIGFSQQIATTSSLTSNGYSPKIQDVESLIYNKPDGRFHEFSVWLQKMLIANSEADRVVNRALVERIFSVINAFTHAGLELTSHTDTYVKTKNNPEGIPLELVSQGYKNVLAWLGFFMKRLWEYGQTLPFAVEDFTKLPAVCLIDEIDTYLHPKWQYTILEALVNAFPNVQFMVTTHSPYVVGSIPNDKIQIFVCEQVGLEAQVKPFESIHVYGSKLDTLNELVFETPSRIGEVAKRVSELRTALQQNDFENFEKTKQHLVNIGIDIQSDAEIKSLISLANTKQRMAKK